MNAAEMLTHLSAEVAAQELAVRAEYALNIAAATRLMRRHGARSVEEAMRVEAKQRVLRQQWAEVTKGVA